MNLKALRERRAKLIADARAVLDKADSETRGLSPEEVVSQTAMLADARQVALTIRNAEEIELEERGLIPESQRETAKPKKSDGSVENTEQRTAYNAALRSYIRNGFGMMTPEETNALRSGYVRFEGEDRAQSTISGAAGGFAVAPDTSMYGKVVEALKFFGGMRSAGCTPLSTATGADLPITTDDDTSNTGVIVGEEGSQGGGSNVALGQRVLHAYLYSSKIVKVSWQLLSDSSFDIEAYLGRKLGMRLGRIQNTHFTTGTGNAQPQGVVTASTVGRQSAVGNTLSVPFDDVIRLIHSVDVAYRGPACRFMLHDLTAQAYELLKDGDGQYLWKTSVSEGGPDRLKGYPVVINNDMAQMAASAKHTAFGDFSNYYIREVQGIQIVRLNELYAENGQVGFMAFMRADGGLVDAGQGPIKTLQNSAT
jgi:HK97 family phage major capsid protein